MFFEVLTQQQLCKRVNLRRGRRVSTSSASASAVPLTAFTGCCRLPRFPWEVGHTEKQMRFWRGTCGVRSESRGHLNLLHSALCDSASPAAAEAPRRSVGGRIGRRERFDTSRAFELKQPSPKITTVCHSVLSGAENMCESVNVRKTGGGWCDCDVVLKRRGSHVARGGTLRRLPLARLAASGRGDTAISTVGEDTLHLPPSRLVRVLDCPRVQPQWYQCLRKQHLILLGLVVDGERRMLRGDAAHCSSGTSSPPTDSQ